MKVMLRNKNNILDPVEEFLRRTEQLTDNLEEANVLVVWQDILGFERDLVIQAKKLGVPSIVVEHGYNAHSDYLAPRSYPLLADKFAAWGEWSKDRMKEAGIPEDKIEVVGTSIYDKLGPRMPHNGINVLFAPLHWDTEIEENININHALWDLRSKYNITTKLIEGQNPEYYINPIVSERNTPDHLLSCWAALSGADVLISVKEGTFETIAYRMGIPVVIVTDWKPKELLGIMVEDANSHTSDVPVRVDLANLEHGINLALNQHTSMARLIHFSKYRLGRSKDNTVALLDLIYDTAKKR